MNECECLEQFAQIQSEISQQQQLDSSLGDVIPINISQTYDGDIEVDDWQLIGNYFYYIVPASEHNLSDPNVVNFLVYNNDGKESCIYSFTVLPNDDIRFRSSYKCKVSYKIEGDR